MKRSIVRNLLFVVIVLGLSATTAYAEKKQPKKSRTWDEQCDDKFSPCANYCDKSKKTETEIRACENDCLDEVKDCKNHPPKPPSRQQPISRDGKGKGEAVLER